MARETPLQRDLHLQQLIVRGDLEGAAEYFSPVLIERPLSRALGYACRYAGPQTVRMLIGGGATFEYNRHSPMRTTNGIAGIGMYADVLERYMYLLDTPMSAITGQNKLAQTDQEASTRVRAEAFDGVVAELVENAALIGFDPSIFLFLGLAFGEDRAVDALKKAGVTRFTGHVRRLFADEPVGRLSQQDSVLLDLFRQRVIREAGRGDEEGRLEPFLRAMRSITGSSVRFRVRYSTDLPEGMTEQQTLSMLRHTTLSKHYGHTELMQLAIRSRFEKLFVWMLEQGWVRTWNSYEQLRRYMEERSGSERFLGLLMAHQKASGMHCPKQQSMNPFSAANLRRTWSTRTLPNGTLEITSFRGAGSEDTQTSVVVVPDTIGKRTVTSIDHEAFSFRGSRNARIDRARRAIREISIPGTVRTVPESLFSGHENLERVIIGEGTISVGQRAFEQCTSLREVHLPSTLKQIGSEAFQDCEAFEVVTGGENVQQIQPRAFCGCTNLIPETGTLFIGEVLAAIDPTKFPSAAYALDERCAKDAAKLRGDLPLLTYLPDAPDLPGTGELPATIDKGCDVVLGAFPQKKDFLPMPLHWTCLSANDDEAILITRDAIACMHPYLLQKGFDWYAWTHNWLNTVFCSFALSPAEYGKIVDGNDGRVFLLSAEEVEALMPHPSAVRHCSVTEYAHLQFNGRQFTRSMGSWLTRDQHPTKIRVVSTKHNEIVRIDRPSPSNARALGSANRNLFLRPALRVRNH